MIEDDQELVAAQAGRQVVRPHHGLQAARDDLQHPVADLVTIPIVEGFEFLEIEKKQAERPIGGDRGFQLLRNAQPVCNSGQRIGLGLNRYLGDFTLDIATIANHRDRVEAVLELEIGDRYGKGNFFAGLVEPVYHRTMRHDHRFAVVAKRRQVGAMLPSIRLRNQAIQRFPL